MYDLHRGMGKERASFLKQSVVPEGLKPERLTLHERHTHIRASMSLEVESQVSMGPLVSCLVVGLDSRRDCKVQGCIYSLGPTGL